MLFSVIEAEIACTLCHITTTLTMPDLRSGEAENWVSWGSRQGVVAVADAIAVSGAVAVAFPHAADGWDKLLSSILMAARQANKHIHRNILHVVCSLSPNLKRIGKLCANNCNCLISVTEQGVSHSIVVCILQVVINLRLVMISLHCFSHKICIIVYPGSWPTTHTPILYTVYCMWVLKAGNCQRNTRFSVSCWPSLELSGRANFDLPLATSHD